MPTFNRIFTIQWHITNKCDFNCKHCYMTLEQRKKIKGELTTKEALKLIDDIADFASVAKVLPRICFTGGNPLLRNDIETILSYSNKNGIMNHILGNPSFSNKQLEMMQKNNVTRYQISLDGLKETHDYFRGPGSYELGLEAIHKLSEAGITPVIMSTATTKNQKELPKLARTVIKHGAKRFDFARLVPIGNGADLKDLIFTPQEFKNFLNSMYNEYKKLIKEEVPDRCLGTKDPLWSLLLYEKGELEIPENKNKIYSGCSIAKSGFCMEPDGTLYACRRMPVDIGNIKDINIRDFFFNNEFMNQYRQVDKIESCGDCDLLSLCRGCRAVAWAENGNYFERDPQCWK